MLVFLLWLLLSGNDSQFLLSCNAMGSKRSKKARQLKQNEEAKRQQQLAARNKPRPRTKAEIKEARAAEHAQYIHIEQPKVPKGVNPKTILCERFRARVCLKGSKCKFGHDLSLGRMQKRYDVATHKSRFKLEKEVGMMEKERETAMEREDYSYAQSLKDDIDKLRNELWRLDNPDSSRLNDTVSRLSSSLFIEEPPITQTHFLAWYREVAVKEMQAKALANRERRRRGILTGREFFTELIRTQRPLMEGEEDSDAEELDEMEFRFNKTQTGHSIETR